MSFSDSYYRDSLTGRNIKIRERDTGLKRDVIASDPASVNIHWHFWNDRVSGNSGMLRRPNH